MVNTAPNFRIYGFPSLVLRERLKWKKTTPTLLKLLLTSFLFHLSLSLSTLLKEIHVWKLTRWVKRVKQNHFGDSLRLLTAPPTQGETHTSKTRSTFLAPCFDIWMSAKFKLEIGQKPKIKVAKVLGLNMIKCLISGFSSLPSNYQYRLNLPAG